jgi:hypothetical protein
LIAHAEGTGGDTWEDVVRVVVSEVWPVLTRNAIPLTGALASFVTFDGPDPVDRSSAAAVHDALALARPLKGCFIELKLDQTVLGALRVPTVGDAVGFEYFAGSKAGSVCGWTKPHSNAQKPQPEAVVLGGTLQAATSLRFLRS